MTLRQATFLVSDGATRGLYVEVRHTYFPHYGLETGIYVHDVRPDVQRHHTVYDWYAARAWLEFLEPYAAASIEEAAHAD